LDVCFLSLILTDGLLRTGDSSLDESSSDLNSNVFSASNERSLGSADDADALGNSENSSGLVTEAFGLRPG
jgi:hypothetical protein